MNNIPICHSEPSCTSLVDGEKNPVEGQDQEGIWCVPLRGQHFSCVQPCPCDAAVRVLVLAQGPGQCLRQCLYMV